MILLIIRRVNCLYKKKSSRHYRGALSCYLAQISQRKKKQTNKKAKTTKNPHTYTPNKTDKVYKFLILIKKINQKSLLNNICNAFVKYQMYFNYFGMSNKGSSWSYGSCIYHYLCNQCLSPLKLRRRIPVMARCTRFNIMFVSDLQQVSGFLHGTPVSSTNKTDRQYITQMLLKVAL